MPYIKLERRRMLSPLIDNLCEELASYDFDEGELNYTIYCMMKHVWKNNPRYATLNKLSGVLNCCDKEIYRRLGVPYEEKKMEENGDV